MRDLILYPARQTVIAELIEERPARCHSIDPRGGAADRAGQLLPPGFEIRRRHGDTNTNGAGKGKPLAQASVDVAAAVIKRRHIHAGHGNRDGRHTTAGGLGALTSRGEVQRFPQARAANKTKNHRAAGPQMTAANGTERLE
jgi:hypothetical protein